MEFTIIIAALVSNFLTKYLKPNKEMHASPFDEEARRTFVRVINAVLALLGALAAWYFIGGEVDQGVISSSVEIIVSATATFLTAQGAYLLNKR